jgi:tetratricopeptide (TPR) repeat protein
MKRVTARDLARGLSLKEQKKLLAAEQARLRGDTPGAAEKYRALLAKNPRNWPALFQLAAIMHTINEHAWAIAALERLVDKVPGFAEGYYNLGTILQSVGRYEEAAAHLERAVTLAPELVGARTNYGNALLGLGRVDEALAQYDAAIALTPDSADAEWNRSHVLLFLDDWVRGWASYEARWKIPGFCEMNQIQLAPDGPQPLPWRGAPLDGKTLLVCGEQGYGDDLMCLRYAPLLRDRGATTIWALRKPLLRLAEKSVAPDRVMLITDPMPPCDYVITTMSLHHRLGITLDTVPGAEGYLKAA